MKMSTKGRYGLRVMMELAAHYGEGPQLVEPIAKRQDISGKYIHVLVTGLRTAGLIRSVRGPAGGYELTREPARITALDVIQALEGPTTPVDCVPNPGACLRAQRCATRDVWCDVSAAIDSVLGRLTLEQLAANQRAKDSAAGAVTYDI